jgi:phosphoribulokinase
MRTYETTMKPRKVAKVRTTAQTAPLLIGFLPVVQVEFVKMLVKLVGMIGRSIGVLMDMMDVLVSMFSHGQGFLIRFGIPVSG